MQGKVIKVRTFFCFSVVGFIYFIGFVFFFLQTIFFYCCSSTVISIFPLPLPHGPPLILRPFGFVHVSFIHVPWQPLPFSPIIPLPTPLWLLSVCSLFQCLWLYFACLFVLLIRFQLHIVFVEYYKYIVIMEYHE